MRRLAAALLALLVLPAAAGGESVVAGLSTDTISITANFDGSDILIYGAVKREAPIPAAGPLEVIVTVEGPAAPVRVRRKSREMGIWINTDTVVVDSAPSFYEVATTGPLDRILSSTEDLRHRISIPLAVISVGAPMDIEDAQSFSEALIRIREGTGDYHVQTGGVRLTEETLFRADIDLPANLTEGDYKTRIFLLRDRAVVALHEQVIDVRKVGLERWLFTLAYGSPVSYGILSIVLAVVLGWAASAAFRYIRS
ncbi:MAG: hypothetical protein RLZZ528_884 [Pseudomonadota bacterium]|jgi:uncharacterized protein (TIGR02186 family)